MNNSSQKPQAATSMTKNIGLALGILVCAMIWITPIQGLSATGSKAMAIAALTAIWWIFAVMPPVFPAILACVLYYVLNVAKPSDAFAGFVSPSIWMLFFALVIAKGVDRSGIGKRIATLLMARMPLSFNGMVAVFIALCFIFPFIIPSAAAIVALMMTLAIGFMDALGIERNPKNKVSAGLTCFIAILSLTFGRVPLTGSVPNFIATGLVRDLTGVEISWMGWLTCMWIVAPLSAIATYYYVTKMYKPDISFAPEVMRSQINQTVDSLGPMSSAEKRSLFLVAAAIVLWALDPYLKIGTNQIGIIIGMLYLMPYIGVLNMADFKTLSFDTFVFAGGSYSMGVVLSKTGFAEWAASGITAFSFLKDSSFLMAGSFVILFAVAIHFILETLGEVSLLTPILIKTGILPPQAVAMLLPYGAGLYIFPYQATPIILSLGFNTTGWSDITKYGLFLTIVGLLQAFLLLATYWAMAMV
jgi:anion transporter